MKKILLLLLLATFSIQAQTLQNPTYGNVKLKNNITDNSATKVNVQSTDGTINTISKSDLVNVVEVNDVPSLPLTGEVGKIYVVKNVNKIYRWNGTFCQELAVSDISGLQAQIDLKANNSDVVKLTGDQTISGQKSFSLTGKIDMQTNNAFPAISVTSSGSNGRSAAEFINSSSFPNSNALRLQTSPSGGVGNRALDVSNQSSIGTGIFSIASNGGVSISSQSVDGDSYISNITFGGTGRNYVGRNNGTETYSVDKTGNVLGNSYIKRSTPANNILLAGGGDLAQGTAFNKNFGTTAGTVVEGGTLGSNAYTSTAYLPLTGGTLNGGLNGTSANFSSSVTVGGNISSNGAKGFVLTNGSTWEISADLNNLYFNEAGISTRMQIAKTTGAVTIGSSVTATSFNGSATLTGTPTAPTATAGTNTTQIATTAFVQENSRPYKVYTALISQSGTNAPVATVLENTLGGTVVWSRVDTGMYLATLTGAFTGNKTVSFFQTGSSSAGSTYTYNSYKDSNNSVRLYALSNGSYLDQIIAGQIEIRVYL